MIRHLRPALAVVALTGLAAAVTGSTAATGAAAPTARVFAVNPVQSSGNETLTDDKDSAAAVPASEYRTVVLKALDGSGRLSGSWAHVQSETGKAVEVGPGSTLSFDRSQDQFEQVMAYYWVTQAQLYLQSLGFGSSLRPVNAESQDVRINQYGVDNSFSRFDNDTITYGKGGVDDAEDAEVIVHEYGHAVHDAQVPDFGTSEEAGSIGEAFGDYLAVEVGAWTATQNGWPIRTTLPCVADWDSVSYTRLTPTEPEHCLRRVDSDKTVADKVGEVHADGEIWSRALWDIRQNLGPATADRIIVNAQFDFAQDTSFADAARATVAAAQRMSGTKAAKVVTKAFEDRGIL